MRAIFICLAFTVMTAVCASAHSDTVFISKDSTFTTESLALRKLGFAGMKPFIGVAGGTTSFSRKDLSAPIENAVAVGLELGFRRNSTLPSTSISTIRSEAIASSYHMGANVVATAPQIVADKINLFRIGLLSRSGKGYNFGSGPEGIALLHGSSILSWTVLGVDGDSVAVATGQPLARFGSALRFGEAWAPAIEFRIAAPVSVQLQYTWSQVYPRHMFWYWAGSNTIEAVADGLTVWFVDEIAKSSPMAAPVISFLLRNGVSAAFKGLRMNRMNWPFSTEAPLNMHTFSLGATVHF